MYRDFYDRRPSKKTGNVALSSPVKAAFHDTDVDIDTDTYTDILARILADTSDTRDFLKLFPWQAERHADILATFSASWNAAFSRLGRTCST